MVLELARTLARMLGMKEAVKPKPKDKSFFWLVQDCQGKDLKASEHVTLMKDKGVDVLVCKTKVTSLRPVWSDEGLPGVVIYVVGGKGPMVTGMVGFPWLNE